MCQKTKPLNEFGKDVQREDGKNFYCLDCVNAYHKECNHKRKMAHNQKRRERYEKSPEKEKAGVILRRAVKEGKIIKPEKCSLCDRDDRPISGHHPDYSKPLEVIFTCYPCHHGEIHHASVTV